MRAIQIQNKVRPMTDGTFVLTCLFYITGNNKIDSLEISVNVSLTDISDDIKTNIINAVIAEADNKGYAITSGDIFIIPFQD